VKMQSQAKKKVIFTDSDRNIAISGNIIEEDDFFLTVKNNIGKIYRIGKKSIVCIKEIEGDKID
jgi:hypothetical protein